LIIEKIDEYCDKLGSVSPTPGGGSAAGIVLSLAASCVEKAMRFSFDDEQNSFLKEISKIKELGLKLSDFDQTTFQNWSEARKLPKETEAQKKERTQKVNITAIECTKVPYEIAKISIKLLNLIAEFLPNCNKWLISDAGVGASMGLSAFESSILNIKINLTYIKNEDFKNELSDFIKNNEIYGVKNRILTDIDKILNY